MLVFACLSPHPPLLLPDVGSTQDRAQVQKTITSLKKLGQQLTAAKPDQITISSPHPDWGFNVPLHFLNKSKLPIKKILTDSQSPRVHFERGKKITAGLPRSAKRGSSRAKRGAFIASGDMSHRLKKNGPYGLHPSGPKFDKEFIKLLKKKDIHGILNMNSRLVEEAGECGLRSFCTLLGALEAARVNWQPKILSYETPFGVGYLTAQLL